MLTIFDVSFPDPHFFFLSPIPFFFLVSCVLLFLLSCCHYVSFLLPFFFPSSFPSFLFPFSFPGIPCYPSILLSLTAFFPGISHSLLYGFPLRFLSSLVCLPC